VAFSFGKLARTFIGVSHQEATSFSEGSNKTWRHLEAAVLTAVEGYHATLDSSKFERLIPRLEAIEVGMRGFAYEGAAMGLTGMDCFLPWKNRLNAYLAGPGSPHIYMAHIGAGEALARLRRNPEPFIARMENRVLCWLVMDGYGFHEGFFVRPRYVERQEIPSRLSSYARHIFDQGLGRSLWFTDGADVQRISATLAKFPQTRQADLWAGVGVACTYVGGVERPAIEALQRAAGPYIPYLAMGSAVVAKGRQRAGNPVPHTDLACEILCGITSTEAAQVLDVAFENLPIDGPLPGYEILQQRLLARFADLRAGISQQQEAKP
jgi:hypothetical protein